MTENVVRDRVITPSEYLIPIPGILIKKPKKCIRSQGQYRLQLMQSFPCKVPQEGTKIPETSTMHIGYHSNLLSLYELIGATVSRNSLNIIINMN